MRLTINGVEFEFLGDPHMGRPFRNNVPLHRLGDREKMQRAELQASLGLARAAGVAAHICVGDLFDKPKVDNRVVAETAEAYQMAARTNKFTPFFVLTGNHDEMRDRDFVSSFQLFTMIVDDDVQVIRSEVRVHLFEDKASQFVAKLAFIPWHPLKTALEMVNEHAELIAGADAVIGHWDVDRRQEGSDNYIPAARLVELGVKMAITGHDHVRRDMVINGLPTVVTGSMQPYSHSEDPEGVLYQTIEAEEAKRRLQCGEDVFRDVCLRVIGEWDDPVPDCLQFKVVANETELKADEALAQVQVADFSMKDLWATAFVDVDPEINTVLAGKFAELGGEQE